MGKEQAWDNQRGHAVAGEIEALQSGSCGKKNVFGYFDDGEFHRILIMRKEKCMTQSVKVCACYSANLKKTILAAVFPANGKAAAVLPKSERQNP